MYIRTAALYGIENFNMSDRELNELEMIETKIFKKMMGITKYCLNYDLMRALNIELTKEKVTIYCLDFLSRILSNDFTRKFYNELQANRITGSYPLLIEKILEPLGALIHHSGDPMNTEEKATVLTDSLKTFGKAEARKSLQVTNIKSIFAFPNLLYYYLNSKGCDNFWFIESKSEQVKLALNKP